MSVVPTTIPDVGATTQRFAQNPQFDPLKAGFGTEEYFVWSRFDGNTTVKDLILMTGLPTERAIEIVRRLYQRGAIVAPDGGATSSLGRGTGAQPVASGTNPPPARPGVAASVPRTTTPPGTRPATAPPLSVSRTRTGSSQVMRPRTQTIETQRDARVAESTPVPDLLDPTVEEQAALDEPGAMDVADRRRVLAALRLVAAGDAWSLLGVSPGADRRSLKRAFFERSKLFHPDRFYGRDIGEYRVRLHIVFEAVSRAHSDLSENGGQRQTAPAVATAPQTPAEYAAELFDRACVAEVSGDPAQALKLFAAAVKLDGQARYLRRAAVCALTAGELRAAEDYAKKAAALEGSDPSTARILGQVLRLLGKLESAEEVLVMALAMKNENDALMRELAAELRTVRADLERAAAR